MVKVQSRGLGKGLAALIAELPQAPARPQMHAEEGGAMPAQANGMGVQEIALAKLTPGKFQPRSHFREEQMRELIDSIARNGVMQPIVVRQIAAAQRETYEIVAGERRWRAAKAAGLNSIPAVVRDFTDQQALEVAIIENIQRADLTPLEEAAGYQRLIHEFDHTQEEIAQVVGKSRSHIANLLRLLNLPEAIRPLLDEGKLSMGHARALLNLPEAVSIRIARECVAGDLSVRQVEAMVRQEQSGQAAETPGKPASPRPRARANYDNGPKDPDILSLEETLSENLGMKVEIRSMAQGQGGELAIAYDSLSQLDEILRKLGGGF